MQMEFNISDYLSGLSEEEKESVLKYIEQLGEKERKSCQIAKDHLGSSFNILKSNGYIEWKAKN
jgi:hypothetical protein